MNPNQKTLLLPLSRQVVADLSLPLLLHFDACRREKGNIFSCNLLCLHLTTAQVLASVIKNKEFYTVQVDAYNALIKACDRHPKIVDLTTTEYSKLRKALVAYLRLIPKISLRDYRGASEYAGAVLNSNSQL